MSLLVLEAIKTMSNGDFETSLTQLEKAYPNNENNPSLNFYLANLLVRNEEFESSLKHLLVSLNNSPENVDYNNLMGVILMYNYLITQ